MRNAPKDIIEDFQNSSIEQIKLDAKNSRSITQSQSGTESESSKDYVGRVAFEFFQNAVDRATEHIWIELVKNENNYEFIISNDGVPFSIYKPKENEKQSDFYGLNNIHNGTKTAGESIQYKYIFQRIKYFIEKEDKSFSVWLNCGENDITEHVCKAVNELPKELPFYFEDYILTLGIKK